MTLAPHTLGDTGLRVSRIGLGLAALGRPGYINLGHAGDFADGRDPQAMARHAHGVLDAAWSGGVRYFDAARSYGRAEEFLARWLVTRRIPASAATVGSKWGYVYTADWRADAEVHEVKDHSLATLRRQLAESSAFLGGHLDLYQIHSATRESGVLENEEVLQELVALRDGGLCIGLSVSGPGQAETIRRAIGLEREGIRLFDTVQATWNLLEPSAGDALAEAHRAGMGVIVKEALANGRLTTRNEDPAFATSMAVLQARAERLGTTIDALALAMALAQPWVDVVLSGAATVDQLRSNLAAVDVRLDDETRAALARLLEPAEQYWRTRSELVWN